MIYKNIGSDKISAIGYGSYGIYNKKHIDSIKYALDCGINFIDTAESYNNGDSEIMIGRAIKDVRKKVFLATKVSAENLSYNDVLNSCYLSLMRLNTNYIDLYQIHWPNSNIPLLSTLEAMRTLLKSGHIRYVGVSNFTYKQLEKAYEFLGNSLVSIQNEYNPIERTVEDEILPFCEKNGIILISYSPYKFSSYIDLKNSTFILSWIISHSNVVTLVKSLNKKHIKMNCNELEYIEYDGDDFINAKKCIYLPIKYIYNVNKECDYIPTPLDLSKDIINYGILKPIKVKEIHKNRYEILEGKLRFLAWCIANPNKDIPVIILNR
jgi:diketogulonate reductase-like aldo/keto reductase